MDLSQDHVRNLNALSAKLSLISADEETHPRGTSRILDVTFNRFASKSNDSRAPLSRTCAILSSWLFKERRAPASNTKKREEEAEGITAPLVSQGANTARGTRTPSYPTQKSWGAVTPYRIVPAKFRDTMSSNSLVSRQSGIFFLLPLSFLIARHHRTGRPGEGWLYCHTCGPRYSPRRSLKTYIYSEG